MMEIIGVEEIWSTRFLKGRLTLRFCSKDLSMMMRMIGLSMGKQWWVKDRKMGVDEFMGLDLDFGYQKSSDMSNSLCSVFCADYTYFGLQVCCTLSGGSYLWLLNRILIFHSSR
eukprot:GHVN01082621.1.p1 GENE.GHVN01082621.1~~GHVN01082621.1.p1  ORF type:complete len:114 (-),score=8.35 GHVN01082621.1:241-582(-)